ncbi:MAG: metallophosphoesterase family protein [Deltaproteobacteria bacterium]|nr:MAG: metallophosphoesterase family protein [Deltaproteobacteria bacterium]
MGKSCKNYLPATLALLLVCLTFTLGLFRCSEDKKGDVTTSDAQILKGPYLQMVTQDSIIIRWETDIESPSKVAYGSSVAYGKSVSGRSFTIEAPTNGTLPTPEGVQHEVVINGLLPSTEYHYQVTSVAVPSEDSTFTTAGTISEPFRFVVHGDNRTNHDDHRKVVEAIISGTGKPDLIVNTGDLVGSGMLLAEWDKFFEIEQPLLKSSPLFPSFGNHELGGAHIFKGYFSLPENTGSGLYYSFNYGNSHFIIINTEEDFTSGSDQYNWANSDLTAAKSDPNIQHIFASFHRPAYSSGNHGGNEAIVTSLVPLFTENDVDIVFSGHDHNYERCQDPELDLNNPEGTVYIVTGGGGAPLYSKDDQNEANNPFSIGVFHSKLHFCQVDVSGSDITVKVFNTDGNIIDSFTTQ